jgi:hypothetical protein
MRLNHAHLAATQEMRCCSSRGVLEAQAEKQRRHSTIRVRAPYSLRRPRATAPRSVDRRRRAEARQEQPSIGMVAQLSGHEARFEFGDNGDWRRDPRRTPGRPQAGSAIAADHDREFREGQRAMSVSTARACGTSSASHSATARPGPQDGHDGWPPRHSRSARRRVHRASRSRRAARVPSCLIADSIARSSDSRVPCPPRKALGHARARGWSPTS